MVQPLLNSCSIYKNDCPVAALALILSPRTVPNMSVYRPGPPLLGSMVGRRETLPHFPHPVVGVSRSVWWFKYGNWCFVLVPCYVNWS